MIKLRAVFEKKGRAKYISHLDLNRCMLRTFRRSKLPIWYTEGFNPHPYFSFALALSLGFESDCEILDFNLNEEIPFEKVRSNLNAVMPEGMKIKSVSAQQKKITEISKAEYDIRLSSSEPDSLIDTINAVMSKDEILVEKKTKKGIKSVDIKPLIEMLSITLTGKFVDLKMRFPAGTQTNYNPNLFLDAIESYYKSGFSIENIRRIAILCENNEIFL